MAKKNETLTAFAIQPAKKRGRPKKLPEQPLPTKFTDTYEKKLIASLFNEELQAKLNGTKEEKESPYYESNNDFHHKRDGQWDVVIGDEIRYFDPTLSYEVTGYRPITMTEGLDFNPDDFREPAITYDRTGHYTAYKEGSKSYNDYWNEQRKRCVEGYTVGKYRITGDHYFFLNFYRMQTVSKNRAVEGTKGRAESFSMFSAMQYEWFHYVALSIYCKKDISALKARAIGFSEILACFGARPFITTRGHRTVYTAFADGQLDPTITKVWTQLDWLALNTGGGFKRLRQKIDNIRRKRASLLDAEGMEYGSKAEIEGIVADKANKIRGDRAEYVIFEECFGKNTSVIMHDYSRKYIQDIQVGDFVMGIDGTPQEVISTCSGQDTLYEVQQKKGESYIINSRHPLYTEWRPRTGNIPDQIKLLRPNEYIALSKYNKRTTYGLKSTGLHFNQNVPIDPYFFGLWLGDGTSNMIEIVVNETDDVEIKDWIVKYFNQFNHICYTSMHKNSSKTTKTLNNYTLAKRKGRVNPIRETFKQYNLINNKHIPKDVFYTPIDYRLKVLAGLIDTDGNLKQGSSSYSFSYEISMSRKELILSVKELAQSCGFYVHYDERVMKRGYKEGSIAHRVSIRGDLNRIPVQVKRKKLPLDYIQTTNTLSTSFDLTDIGHGTYYGITLKGYGKPTDHLFLLNDYTIVHNCGSNPILLESWIQGEALVELGGEKIGTMVSLGTGGDTKGLEGLSKIFNDPIKYNVLPYKNSYSKDGKVQFTAFFIPAYRFSLDPEYVDHRGVTDEVRFRKFYEERRARLDGVDLVRYCAERCFTPDEATMLQGDNMFNSVLLADRLTQIRVHKLYTKPINVELLWDRSPEDQTSRNKVKIVEHSRGKIQMVEPPKRDEDGSPFKNLYVIGIDAIDMGKKDSSTDKDVSDYCIIVYRRQFGVESPKVVAMYKERPTDIREAFETALKLAIWYNAKVLIEYTKISTVTHFTEAKRRDLFMERPSFALTPGSKSNKNLIGIQATEAVIHHGLELISGWIEDQVYNCDFDELLEQMLHYSYENKRKYDCVAAMQMALVADEALMGTIAKKINQVKKEFRDIGYYTNRNGNKQFGTIGGNRNDWAGVRAGNVIFK